MLIYSFIDVGRIPSFRLVGLAAVLLAAAFGRSLLDGVRWVAASGCDAGVAFIVCGSGGIVLLACAVV